VEAQLRNEKNRVEKLIDDVGEWKGYAKSVQKTAAKMPTKSAADS
jgi:hypothetical protein